MRFPSFFFVFLFRTYISCSYWKLKHRSIRKYNSVNAVLEQILDYTNQNYVQNYLQRGSATVQGFKKRLKFMATWPEWNFAYRIGVKLFRLNLWPFHLACYKESGKKIGMLHADGILAYCFQSISKKDKTMFKVHIFHCQILGYNMSFCLTELYQCLRF